MYTVSDSECSPSSSCGLLVGKGSRLLLPVCVIVMQTHALVMGNQLRYLSPLPGGVHTAARAQERLFPGVSGAWAM